MRCKVIIERAGDDPVVGLVGIERSGVTGTQLQRRGCFPVVGEPVQSLELLDTAVGAQLGEQATAPNALELARITNQRKPPPVAIDEGDELVEGGCGQHPGLVHNERRAGRQVELGKRRPVGALPLVEQLGDGVGRDAGVALEGACRLRRRRYAEDDTAVRVEVVGGSGEHAGLAGAGRPDDEDEAIVAGDGRRGIGLQRIETVRFNGLDGEGGSAWAAIAHVTIASSWASTSSDVKPSAVGSIHTDRPSDPRRVVSPGGSRSTRWLTT